MRSQFGLALLLLLTSCSAQTTERIDSKKLLSDLQTLSSDDMEGRRPGTDGSAKARAFIVKRFKEAGLKAFDKGFELSLPGGSTPLYNIVGYVPGTKNPKSFIVLTAHHDHLGKQGSRIFNGADDNASGVAALMALAKYFVAHPAENTLVFAALDGEESSGIGGKEIVANPPFAPSGIKLNLNMDMIARETGGKLFAVGTYHYPFLKPYLEKVKPHSPVKILFGHDKPGGSTQAEEDWTHSSDHIWFHRKKIPFIYFGVEDFAQHHHDTDDFETITRDFYIAAVETILDSVVVFDKSLGEISKASGRG